MKLYHFTHEDALPSILVEGLIRGDVPITRTKAVNAVWFTTDPNPSGHGVCAGEEIVVTPEMAFMSGGKVKVGETIRFADKQKIRIKVEFQTSRTPGLIKWLDFAKKHKIQREWLMALHKAAGDDPKPHTWWLWFGTLPSSHFQSVEVRTPRGYVSVWERPDLLSKEVRTAVIASSI
jgi:hypothetical protein